jgi:dipeptidyl aminopeptidase/acylaminoacyl peptidase
MLQAYKYSSPSVKAVVNFFGPSDMVDMYNNPASPFAPPASIALLLSGTPSSNPSLYFSSSPVNYISVQSAATITFQGGQDFLVRPQQQVALHNRLQANVVINKYVLYPTEGHGWTGARLSDSFNQMQVFLNSVLP